MVILLTLFIPLNSVTGAQIEEECFLLKTQIRTESDWSTVLLQTEGKFHFTDYEIIEGQDISNINVYPSEKSVYLSIGKKPYDTTPVEISLNLIYTANDPTLDISIQKGFIGITSLDFIASSREGDTKIKTINHGHVLSNPNINPLHTEIDGKILQSHGSEIKLDLEDIEPLVFAFYYPWYNTLQFSGTMAHWENPSASDVGMSVNFPYIGVYDSLDPDIIRAHLEMAEQAAIDGLLCSWGGAGTRQEQAIETILNEVINSPMKIGVYYESLRGEQEPLLDSNIIVEELVHIVEKFCDYPNYLKIDEVPVIFVYQAQTLGRDPLFWSQIKEKTEEKVGDIILIGEFWDPAYFEVFQGSHVYNELDIVEHEAILNKSTSTRIELDADSWETATNSLYKKGVIPFKYRISTGTVLPGYDDTEIRSPGNVLPRNELKTYQSYWNNVHEADPDWVIITSFNEWHEGTEIEPSNEYGFKYLEETRKESYTFKNKPYLPPGIPELVINHNFTDSNLFVQLMNNGNGPMYNVQISIDELNYSNDVSVIPANEYMVFQTNSLDLETTTETNILVSYTSPSGQIFELCKAYTILCDAPVVDEDIEGQTPPPSTVVEGVEIEFNKFTTSISGTRTVVTASAWIQGIPDEIEYCSIDVILDGNLIYGECWTDIANLNGNPGIVAPACIGYEKVFELPEGIHEIKLRSYARNQKGEVIKETEVKELNIKPKFLSIDFGEISVNTIGDNLIINAEALIESYPAGIEYCSMDILLNGNLLYGECWTDSDEGTIQNDRLTAPAIMSYNFGISNPGPGNTLSIRAYVRNDASMEKIIEKIINYQKPEENFHEYLLNLINADRADFGVAPLRLSRNTIAQEYANEMLFTNLFQHNPNLPKTMAENIGMIYNSQIFSVSDSLDRLEYLMMYEDEAHDWGHRENIINPAFNEVSIGIAFDEDYLYLVQDFLK